jgi:hypothetical protein
VGIDNAAFTADTGVIGGRQGSLIVLAISIAAGLAVAGAWLTIAGPGRRAALALAQPGRKAVLSLAQPSRKAMLALARPGRAALSLLRRRGRHTR